MNTSGRSPFRYWSSNHRAFGFRVTFWSDSTARLPAELYKWLLFNYKCFMAGLNAKTDSVWFIPNSNQSVMNDLIIQGHYLESYSEAQLNISFHNFSERKICQVMITFFKGNNILNIVMKSRPLVALEYKSHVHKLFGEHQQHPYDYLMVSWF